MAVRFQRWLYWIPVGISRFECLCHRQTLPASSSPLIRWLHSKKQAIAIVPTTPTAPTAPTAQQADEWVDKINMVVGGTNNFNYIYFIKIIKHFEFIYLKNIRPVRNW